MKTISARTQELHEAAKVSVLLAARAQIEALDGPVTDQNWQECVGEMAASTDLAAYIAALGGALDEYQATIEARLLMLEPQPGTMPATMKPKREPFDPSTARVFVAGKEIMPPSGVEFESHDFDHASQTAGGDERETDE